MHRFGRLYAIAGLLPLLLPFQEGSATQNRTKTRAKSDPPPGWPPQLDVEHAAAETEAEMKPYAESLPGRASAKGQAPSASKSSFEMLPIPSGTFLMGSAPGEKRRKKSEGPKHEVQISAFWMGRCEVTWDEFHVFMLQL
ncbi:MAG: SUMF1/EgtB/PvdO family nonheme iron enzyme, partial [Planctomycetota bacterium]